MAKITYNPGLGAELGGEAQSAWTTPDNAGGTADGQYAHIENVMEGTNTLVVSSFGIPSTGPAIKGIVISVNGTITGIPGFASWSLYSNTTLRYSGTGNGIDPIGGATNNLGFDTWLKLSTLKIRYRIDGDNYDIAIDNFTVDIYTASGGYRTRVRGFGRKR